MRKGCNMRIIRRNKEDMEIIAKKKEITILGILVAKSLITETAPLEMEDIILVREDDISFKNDSILLAITGSVFNQIFPHCLKCYQSMAVNTFI